MKTQYIFLFLTMAVYGQRENSYGTAAINTQQVSPNIAMLSEQLSAVSNLKELSVYANKPLAAKHDNYTLGIGYNWHEQNNYHNIEGYVGRLASDNGKFRMSLIFGYYQVDSKAGALTPLGVQFKPRTATYGGASLSYHPSEKTYFGLIVRDVYDVGMSLGDDETFFYYEAMTPTAFASVILWDGHYENITAYGDISYHTGQKTSYTAAVAYENENWKAGLFYNAGYQDSFGGSLQYSFEWISIYAAVSRNINLGIILK